MGLRDERFQTIGIIDFEKEENGQFFFKIDVTCTTLERKIPSSFIIQGTVVVNIDTLIIKENLNFKFKSLPSGVRSNLKQEMKSRTNQYLREKNKLKEE